MKRRIVYAAAALAFLAALRAGTPPVHAASQPYPLPQRGCLTFEDDSFVCGTYVLNDNSQWTLVTDRPYVTGCIPGGLCDDDWTDDCPTVTEDVECWDLRHGSGHEFPQP